MLITTVIPVFNRAHTVGRAIESVLAQELPPGYNGKLIIVDDGSSDDLEAALHPYIGRLTCARHDRNLGAAAARNTGVAAAEDGYIAFLDSDDTWLPGKFVAQVEAMRAANWLASCTGYFLRRPGRASLVSPRYKSGPLSLSDLAWGCYVSPGSTLVFQKSLFSTIGPLDMTMRRLEDWDWLLRFAQQHVLGFISSPLAEVDPSRGSKIAPIRDAVERMKKKHGSLSRQDRRRLLAGLDLTFGATYYGQREYGAAVAHVLKSIWHAPLHNEALSAVLHNYFSR